MMATCETIAKLDLTLLRRYSDGGSLSLFNTILSGMVRKLPGVVCSLR